MIGVMPIKRVFGVGPCLARREVQQGQQAQGGTLVLLCSRQAQGSDDLLRGLDVVVLGWSCGQSS
jgi:hypothetical protein